MSDYIFIYGTLSPEIAPKEIADVVRRLKFVGHGFVHGKLFDLGEFPGVKLVASSRSKIRGSVYLLPSDRTTIKSLDAYEEFFPARPVKSLYVRKQTLVTLENGEKIRSWIYEYNGDTSRSPMIKSGDYSKIAA